MWIPRGREALRVDAEVLEACPHDPHLVGLVVDRERRAVAEPLRVAAQHPAARGVEGEDPGRARLPPEHLLEPLAHLSRGLVRERDREDLVRPHAVRADQVSDPVREHAGLPGARSGDDEERAVDVQNGLALGRIEVGEEVFVGRDAHASMLAAVSARRHDVRSGRVACLSAGRARRRRRRRCRASRPGSNVIPPNSTGTSISPAPAFPLGRGFVPSALIPTSSARSATESRTQPFTMTPAQPFCAARPATMSPSSATRQRAAAVDDEHAPLAGLTEVSLEHDVVLVAANGRDRPGERRQTPRTAGARARRRGLHGMRVEDVGGRGHRPSIRPSQRNGNGRPVSAGITCAVTHTGVAPYRTE